jgi:hypothetical protein
MVNLYLDFEDEPIHLPRISAVFWSLVYLTAQFIYTTDLSLINLIPDYPVFAHDCTCRDKKEKKIGETHRYKHGKREGKAKIG